MKYHSMIPELTISDIEITKDFYLNKLGFTLEMCIRDRVAIHPILSNIPEFACAMVSGAFLSFVMKKMGIGDYIDRATISRISGVALDFLVCSAIATLSIKVDVYKRQPIQSLHTEPCLQPGSVKTRRETERKAWRSG